MPPAAQHVFRRAQASWLLGKFTSSYDGEDLAHITCRKTEDFEASLEPSSQQTTERGLEHEADPRQAEKLLCDLKVGKRVQSVGARASS